MNLRNALATVVGFGVAALVLGALVAVVGAGEVLAALSGARPGPVALVAAALVAWICLWGAALRVVLAAVGTDVSVGDAVLVHAGAAFANHVTPFGQAGGEPVAAWLITDVSDAEFERALGAMASFDTINVVPSLSFALVGLAYYGTTSVVGERFRLLTAGVLSLAVGLPVAGIVAWRRRRTLEAWLVRATTVPLAVLDRAVPRVDAPDAAQVADHVREFVTGIERVATDRRRLVLAVALSASGWAVQAAGLWFAFRALGATIPPYVPLFVIPLGAVAGGLPTPGGLGGIEAVQIAILTAATTVAAPTVTAAVAISRVGGFFLTTSVGAAAIAVLKVRTADPGGYA